MAVTFILRGIAEQTDARVPIVIILYQYGHHPKFITLLSNMMDSGQRTGYNFHSFAF